MSRFPCAWRIFGHPFRHDAVPSDRVSFHPAAAACLRHGSFLSIRFCFRCRPAAGPLFRTSLVAPTSLVTPAKAGGPERPGPLIPAFAGMTEGMRMPRLLALSYHGLSGIKSSKRTNRVSPLVSQSPAALRRDPKGQRSGSPDFLPFDRVRQIQSKTILLKYMDFPDICQ